MTDSALPELTVTPRSAARMLGLSRSRLYVLINEGHIPAMRLSEGGRLRIPVARLTALVEAGADAGPRADLSAHVAGVTGIASRSK